MAYDIFLEEKLRNILKEFNISKEGKRMMGRLCFMVNNKMCFGIIKDQLMARIDPEIYDEEFKKEGVWEMNFTGRSMKRFVFIDNEVIDMEEDLNYWVDLCLEFNPKAKSRKKR